MKFGDHISSRESFEKDSSRAPATVPVASKGTADAGDHAKVEVRWISFSFMRNARRRSFQVAMSESLTDKDINDSLHLEGTEHG
jgi:hypothetical protein